MKVYLRHANETDGHHVDDLSIDELKDFVDLVKQLRDSIMKI